MPWDHRRGDRRASLCRDCAEPHLSSNSHPSSTGSITAIWVGWIAAPVSFTGFAWDYAYDAAGRLTRERRVEYDDGSIVATALDQHYAYDAAGSVGFVGRTLAAPFVGLAVVRAADLAAAEALAAGDPAAAAGVMRIEVQPFRVVFAAPQGA